MFPLLSPQPLHPSFFPLLSSPGGLQRLIWINEQVDLHVSPSPLQNTFETIITTIITIFFPFPFSFYSICGETSPTAVQILLMELRVSIPGHIQSG